MQKDFLKKFDPDEIIALLSPLLTEKRKERIEYILSLRTRFITVILYDLYHEHNMSAVVRSLEAFGIQDCYVIEKENRFCPSPGVAIGAEKWINIKRFKSETSCFDALRQKGFRIFAADPPEKALLTRGKGAFDIRELDLEKGPVAICFGKELDGLNDHIRGLCDGTVYIPMLGFTESLNVSVTAAICLYELRRKLDALKGIDWHLKKDEKERLRAYWYLSSIKHGERILFDLKKRQKKEG